MQVTHKVVKTTVDYIAKYHCSDPDCDIELYIPMLRYGELISQDSSHSWVFFFELGFIPISNEYIEDTGKTVESTRSDFGADFGVSLHVGRKRPISIAQKNREEAELCK